MILVIIFASILFVGIVGIVGCAHINKHHPIWTTPDWLDNIFIALIIVGAIANITSGVGLIVNGTTKTADYENMAYEKTVLEYRLQQVDNGESVIGNELVYNDIVKFNNNLRSIKRWANNPWTSWYNNDKIANNIDYIEIPNMKN